jgi:hypothetical protein
MSIKKRLIGVDGTPRQIFLVETSQDCGRRADAMAAVPFAGDASDNT